MIKLLGIYEQCTYITCYFLKSEKKLANIDDEPEKFINHFDISNSCINSTLLLKISVMRMKLKF